MSKRMMLTLAENWLAARQAGVPRTRFLLWQPSRSVPKAVPLYIKMAPVPGFTRKAVSGWANANLAPDCIVTSDGLSCFAGVTDAGSASTGQSSRTVASLRICQNSTGSIRFLATSRPVWAALTMRSISPNTEPVTSVRLFTVSTGASVLKRFLCVCSSLQQLPGLARHVGFGKLKNLSNQVIASRCKASGRLGATAQICRQCFSAS